LFSVKGGDSIQIVQTAEQLTRLGIEVEIRLCHERIDYARYDLLHFFNIIRPADILFHTRKARCPFVVSTIFIDYNEYDRYHRKGLPGLVLRWLPGERTEYIKCLARFLKGNDRLVSPAYLWAGQRKSISRILQRASVLFTNSELETRELKKRFGVRAACMQVPNGIDPELFTPDKQVKKDPFLVLCVARIEGIKNQINLIRALRFTEYNLLIIGSPAPNQQAYFRECRRLAAPNIRFIGHTRQEELIPYYRRAKVHVLPSWFEACGLSSLEAAAMGCNLVITDRGYTRAYFGDHAFYCEPDSPRSIFSAVQAAARADIPYALQEKILADYTWPEAASRIAGTYRQLLQTPEHADRHHGIKRHPQPLRRV
jgi:glycosyltransferase involved in cell wall biosynthesis